MYRPLALSAAILMAVACSVAAEDKEAKPKDIEEIMKKAHGGAKAYIKAVNKAVKDKKWDDAAPTAKAWAAIAPHLSSFDPPKGDKASWKKMADAYGKQVKELEAAVKEKDEKAAKAALGKIQKGCGSCHKAHKAD